MITPIMIAFQLTDSLHLSNTFNKAQTKLIKLAIYFNYLLINNLKAYFGGQKGTLVHLIAFNYLCA